MESILITLIAVLIAYRICFGSLKGVFLPLVLIGVGALIIKVSPAFLGFAVVNGFIPYLVARNLISTSDQLAIKFAVIIAALVLVIPYLFNLIPGLNTLFGIAGFIGLVG